MKKRLLYSAILVGGLAFAQQKQLSMEEAVLGLSTHLRVESLFQLQWIPHTDAWTEQVKTHYGSALVRRSLPDFNTDTLMRSTEFDNQSLPYLNWLDDNFASFQSGKDWMIWDQSKQKASQLWQLDDTAEAVTLEPLTKQLAYVIDNDLFLYDGEQLHQITSDGSKDIVNGKIVHREEFGIDRGIFFSPKGNLIAFYRMDQSMVEDYPIIDWTNTPAENHNIKYPFAGRTSHQVKLKIYDPKTKKTIEVQTQGPKDLFLTNIAWSPDEQSIYIVELNRDQNHLKLNEYEASSGKFLRTILEEKDDKYVEPQHPMYFLPNEKEFVWWSQRDGFMHLYRYSKEGKLLNKITQGDWLVNEIVGINAHENQLLITSTKDGAMEKHLYAVNWKNGKINRIDDAAGYHHFIVNSDGTYALDIWSNEETPRKIDVLSTDKKFKKNLLTAKNPLTSYQLPKVENVTLKAKDGTDLYGKLIYPTNFDAQTKYPVIVYLYNGPHAQLNLNRFPASGNLWYDYLAQQGYVVWVLDGRGSSNRGLEFEQAIYRQLGTVEMEDQLQGIDYLKSLSFVDPNRMGIHGWSYGGFMTTSMMLHHPEVFKAGVAGGPVMDWSMYEIMYGERYMDTPEKNPTGYAKNLLTDKTHLLKGKLLLIHGAQDDVVLLQHSVNFLRDAVSKGVQVDFFLYPGHEHNVRGKDRVHLMQKVTDYFDLFLKQ